MNGYGYDYDDEEDDCVPGLLGNRHSSVRNRDYPKDTREKTDQEKDYENGWRKTSTYEW